MAEISIIVPVYNAEKYLERCLNSILAQKFINFEVLLINDGSSDESLYICNMFALKDNRITVFDKKNEGVSATRQYGIEKATGAYSIFIDADDWIEPNMLAEMHHTITKQQNDILICNYFINNNLIKEEQRANAPKALIQNMLNSKIKGVMWNKLVKHSLYKQFNIRFPSNINFCEDVYVCIQLFLSTTKIGFTENAYYHYMDNPCSITRKPHKNIIIQRIDFVNRATKLLQENHLNKNWLMWHKLDLKWIGFASNLFSFQEYKEIFPELFQEYNACNHPKYLKNIIILYFASYHFFWNFFKRFIYTTKR